MGKNFSKPLEEATAWDIAKAVVDLGAKQYSVYAERIEENAVDGALLDSLNEAEFAETLDDLNVSRLHKRVLTKAWLAIKARDLEQRDPSLSTHASWTETTCTWTASLEHNNDIPLCLNIVDQDKEHRTETVTDNTLETNDYNDGFVPALDNLNDDPGNCKKSPFPTYDEVLATGKPPRSAMLPFFNDEKGRASKVDMQHLADDIWDFVDSKGCDRPPIHKKDMERVAVIEEMGLKEIPFDDPVGIALKGLVALTVQIFDVQFAEITILDHEKMYSLAMQFQTTQDVKDVILNLKTPFEVDQNGEPWLCGCTRSAGLCNYAAYTGCTFTSHDVWKDESFRWVYDMNGMRFYSSSPIIVNGYAVANLCIYDFVRPRPEFGAAQQMQQEQIAEMAAQHFQNWSLRRQINCLKRQQHLLELQHDKEKTAPNSNAAIVFTDVQDSSVLWEANPDAMNEALHLHDGIMRAGIAQFHGYEYATEGDSFRIAFHDVVDALGFAIKVQEDLYDAEWQNDILEIPQACDDKSLFLRGLRVRIALHFGPVHCRVDSMSGKREYVGETASIARSLEAMCHGGQIVTTAEVWNVANHLSSTKFGAPQVIDLGSHVLWTGSKTNDGLTVKGVVQLVPASLSYDYNARCTFRRCGKRDTDPRIIQGRQFSSLRSVRQMSASFHDAPYDTNVVTILFVFPCEVERLFEDSDNILAALSQQIDALLGAGPGYRCKNFMIAFPNESIAVIFGLNLQEYVTKHLVLSRRLSGLLKIGIHRGPFTSMGPNAQSGRADYFGKVVNRAARIAGAAEPGRVVLGKVSSACEPLVPAIEGVLISYLGKRLLKGLSEEISLHECIRCVR